jgi:hypothetical protein
MSLFTKYMPSLAQWNLRDWPEARDGAGGLSQDLRAATCRDANETAAIRAGLAEAVPG